MKDTAEESAILKQRFKHELATDALRAESMDFPAEWDEACREVEEGWDTCTPGSPVAEELGWTP